MEERHNHMPHGDAGSHQHAGDQSGSAGAPVATAPGTDTSHGEAPTHAHDRHEGHQVADFRRRFWVCLALTVPVLLMSPGLPLVPGGRILHLPGADAVLLVLSAVLYAYGGAPFLRGLVSELRDRTPGMMTLVAVAITVAFFYSAATVFGLEGMPFFWESATLIDVMLLGHWIEMRSVGEASYAVESLARLVPSRAHRRTGDGLEDVPTTELVVGDIVLVRPGEKLPADGTVVEGSSSVDESLLTGESVPVLRLGGDEVIGGSLNGTGSLVVRVDRVGSDTFLSQVVRLVADAQASRSRTQDLADRAAMWLTVVALGGGTLTFAAWLVAGGTLAFAMERAVTVMVIACPHALGLAIPLVVAASTTIGARSGVFIRDRNAFEAARRLDVVVFDKTGTLTEGRFAVRDVVVLASEDANAVLQLAGAVEQHSEHPIARAIVEAAPKTAATVEDFEAEPGAGARARVDGADVSVVSPSHLPALGIPVPVQVSAVTAEGRTTVAVVRSGAAIGLIALSDEPRQEAAEAVAALRRMHVRTVMLTGDSDAAAAGVAARLGIESYFAGVSPAGKADVIRRLQSDGSRVAMVGDGVNDAPPLAAADVGFAIGAGTDVAVATADVVLLKDDPRDVARVAQLAGATHRKMVQNLAWATGYNIVAIPLAAGALAAYGVILPPALGGALMALSTIIVAINARLLSVTNG